MATTLARFAENACGDLPNHGVVAPLLEAQTEWSIYTFSIAPPATALERQRALTQLSARLGNVQACAENPLKDLFVRTEAWIRAPDPPEHSQRGSRTGASSRMQALVVTHLNVQTGALAGQVYLMRRVQGGRLVGLLASEDLRDGVRLDLLSSFFLAGVRAGPSAPRGKYPPVAPTDYDLRPA
jgi:hypothetical protein